MQVAVADGGRVSVAFTTLCIASSAFPIWSIALFLSEFFAVAKLRCRRTSEAHSLKPRTNPQERAARPRDWRLGFDPAA